MDVSLFSSLLRNLLHIPVLYVSGDGTQAFWDFQDKYCYHPALQPAFTAAHLSRSFSGMQENIIYGYQDDIGVCLQFFRAAEGAFFIGPFVREDFDATRTQSTLIAHHIPASFAPSVHLYFNAFPLISATYVRETALACIRALTEESAEYSYCTLRSVESDLSAIHPSHEEVLDYSTLHRRYDLENRFLRMIETGDTENVLQAYKIMTLDGLDNRYINAMYQNPDVSFAMIRALARKAAERGGAPIVEIHEITQRAMREMATRSNVKEKEAVISKMVLELAGAVRQAQMDFGAYSPPIRRVIERIRQNFSQDISPSDLARLSGFSESYISKAFRKEVGSTISQYIAHLRCRQAAQMLEEGRLSIQEISSYVGYEDSNYFVKVFRKQYDMTPSDYRAAAGGRC